MNQLKTALRMFLFMTLLTGLAYPLLITAFAQLTMPQEANGSLIKNGEHIIGSALIAQKTTDNKYFWPRPSAIDYDPMKPSGGSNLGPTSKKLKDLIEKRKKQVGEKAPSELLYASGSGLDPHISLETAYFQVERVAGARGINKELLINFINAAAQGQRVNVLLLNEALDKNYDGRR